MEIHSGRWSVILIYLFAPKNCMDKILQGLTAAQQTAGDGGVKRSFSEVQMKGWKRYCWEMGRNLFLHEKS